MTQNCHTLCSFFSHLILLLSSGPRKKTLEWGDYKKRNATDPIIISQTAQNIIKQVGDQDPVVPAKGAPANRQ